MLGFNLLAALWALFMLARHGRLALALLRGGVPPGGRARAGVSMLTCLAALAVLALSARATLLALDHLQGGPP